MVAAKKKELAARDETTGWNVEGVIETPLEIIEAAYERVGLNANAEDDWFHNPKPITGGGCALF